MIAEGRRLGLPPDSKEVVPTMARWLLVIAFTAISIFGSIPCRCCAWSAKSLATESMGALSAQSEGGCPKCRTSRGAPSGSSKGQSGEALWTCQNQGAGRSCECRPSDLGQAAICATYSVDRSLEVVSFDRHGGSGLPELEVVTAESSSEATGCTLHVIRPWVFDPIVVCHRLRR